MNWISPEQIVRELKLSARPEDPNAIKRELRVRLAGLHPDKNGGSFTDKREEDEYNEVSSAYEFVSQTQDHSLALIPVSQLPAIFKAVRDIQLAPMQENINSLRTECRAEARLNAHDRNHFPRLTSGTLAAICAALFTFSGSLGSHPLIGSLASNMIFQVYLLLGTAIFGIFFLFTWVRERQEEAHVEWLMSEQGRHYLFSPIICLASNHCAEGKKYPFTARMVSEDIMDKSTFTGSIRQRMEKTLRPQVRISNSVAEKITETHLLELEKRGAIRRVEDSGLDLVYEFSDSALFRKKVD